MKKVVVLGAGLVGKAIAIDLSKMYNVTAADIDPGALDEIANIPGIRTVQEDLTTPSVLKNLIADTDLVVGALPGFLGFKALEQVILAGKDIVDISFFPEDPFGLDILAKKAGVTAVFDCGIAPGMSNMILGYHNRHMKVEDFVCLVGGLPVKRIWPWQYKAVFSPIDVIEEYIRPARFVVAGKQVEREALSDPELVDFEQTGTLEAWNSDGLRSLIKTIKVPNMIEKTLRYPGTIEYLRVLREAGFFSYQETEVDGKMIRPIDLSSKLLFDQWKLGSGEEDLTVMRIMIMGIQDGKRKRYTYNLYDRFDRETNTLSMARTTGYTCTAVATLILEKGFSCQGICPPEYIGRTPENFKFILDHLEKRGVVFSLREGD